jgi:hypothetical protein
MRRGLVWLLAMTPALGQAASEAPMSWSRDGRWVAYLVRTPDRPPPAPGWIFRGRLDPDPVPADGRARHRIYAADAQTGEAVLLEDSAGPLGAPEWGPDGRSLAYCRLSPAGPVRVGAGAGAGAKAAPRFEVVVQEGLHQRRVIYSRRAAGAGEDERRRLAEQPPAWSPDGRYLVVPGTETGPGLTVLRGDNGRVITTLPGLRRAAWSPDGSRLAVVRDGRPETLEWVDSGFGAPRHLAELGETFQDPAWARDGRSILIAARRPADRGQGPVQATELIRVQVESGTAETVVKLGVDSLERGGGLLGLAYSLDREAGDFFWSASFEKRPAEIVWCRPRTQEIVNRFNPLDVSAPVASLALAPDRKTLAVGFGTDLGAGPCLGFCTVGEHVIRPVAADEATRSGWIALVVSRALDVLAAGLPGVKADGRTTLDRPTVLPVPGEVPANQDTAFRLRRLGKIGRELCDRPASGAAAGAGSDRFRDEARLLFDVLSEDYRSALDALDVLDARADSADQRYRLFIARAQVLMGLGETERAGDAIDYLGELERRAPVRFETTPAGVVLTPEPLASRGWARYLRARLDEKAPSTREPDRQPEGDAPASRSRSR